MVPGIKPGTFQLLKGLFGGLGTEVDVMTNVLSQATLISIVFRDTIPPLVVMSNFT